jgi:dTDP-glucose 4,6-dehydratase
LGFIGTNLINKLIKDKNNIILNIDKISYCSNLSTNINYFKSKNYFFKRINLSTNSNLLNKVILDFKPNIIFHLAAESHVDLSLKNSINFFDTNLMGTLNLLMSVNNYLNKFRNKYKNFRFIHVGTDEIYGDLKLNSKKKFNENSNILPNNPYSASKASSDHLVRAWTRSFGLKATISNCSNNFGPYQHEEKLIPRMIGLIASGAKPELYGNGANIRDWIHVDDHNDGVWAVIEKGVVGQTYLLGADNQRSNLEVVRALLGIMGKPEDFIAFIGDRPGHDLRYAIDASDTEAELGWKPKHGNFEEKLAETVNFYTAN